MHLMTCELVYELVRSRRSSGDVITGLRHLLPLNAGVVGPYEDLL